MNSYTGTVDDRIPARLRLDRYIAEHLKLLSRSQVKSKKLRAFIRGKEVKVSRLVKPGEEIYLEWDESSPVDLIPENIPLRVIYENERVLVINKEQGMVVHPGAGNYRGTLANALYFRRLERGGSAEGARPGIVHRLDKDTSGLIIAAYDDDALAYTAHQFKIRKTHKTYAAVVKGKLPVKVGKIENDISRDPRDRKKFTVSEKKGKHALTYYKVVKEWPGYSLLLLRPKTGRTHQLRVHMKHIGHPILGDPLYGSPDTVFPGITLMLHAKRLSLKIPPDGTWHTFKAPMPRRFRLLIRKLEGQ